MDQKCVENPVQRCFPTCLIGSYLARAVPNATVAYRPPPPSLVPTTSSRYRPPHIPSRTGPGRPASSPSGPAAQQQGLENVPPPDLYKRAFTSTYGTDFGVLVLQEGGKLSGGDSGNAYVGTYEEDGEVMTMQVSVTQLCPIPGVVSVIGFNNVVVEMAGRADDGALPMRGTSKQVPGAVRGAADAYCGLKEEMRSADSLQTNLARSLFVYRCRPWGRP